jgi:hypothetical protein
VGEREGEGFWVKGRDCGGFAGVFSGLWRESGRYMKRPIPDRVAVLRRYMNRPIPIQALCCGDT